MDCNQEGKKRGRDSFLEAERLLEMAINKLGLSARAYSRILKVGRTIADSEASDPRRSSTEVWTGRPFSSTAIGD